MSIATRREQLGAPLRDTDFRRYLLARAVSLLGTTMAPVATAFAVFRIGGSTSDLAVVLIAGIAPQLTFGLVGGVLADRISRRSIVVIGHAVACATQLGLAGALVSGVRSTAVVALAAMIVGTCAAFTQPAVHAMLAEIVPRESAQEAGSLLRSVSNCCKVGGPAAAGVLVAVVDPALVIAIDGVTFLVAAVAVSAVRADSLVSRSTESAAAAFVHGFRHIRRHRWLAIFVAQSALIVPAWLMGYQLLGPTYSATRDDGASLWGFMVAVFAAGLLLGSAISLARRLPRPGVVVCLGLTALAAPLLAMALASPDPVVLVAFGVAGVGIDLSIIAWGALVQARVPPSVQGRVAAASSFGQLLLVPVAYAVAGPVSARVGLTPTLLAAAAVVAIAGLAPLLAPDVRAMTYERAGPP